MQNALLRLLVYLLRALRPATRLHPDTLLVIQDRIPLGCCVHATPLYAAIKHARPDCTLVVASRGLGLEVIEHDPHIDYLLDLGGPIGKNIFRRAAQLRHQLRSVSLTPDLILQDASNRAGSHALFALLLRLAPIVGFATPTALYDEHLSYNPALSLIANNLRLIGPETPHTEPAVYFTADELSTARELLQSAENARPIAAFVLQGSGDQPNAWHDDRFAAVIRYVESLGHRSVFLGTAADAANIERIRSLAGSTGTSLAGRTSVPQLAAVLCLCDLLLAVDTGPMHVGRASGLPMVVLGPSWQPPIEWLPLDLPHVRVLRGPTRADIPPDYRLDEIPTTAVIAAIDELQRLYPASPNAREDRATRLLSTTRS